MLKSNPWWKCWYFDAEISLLLEHVRGQQATSNILLWVVFKEEIYKCTSVLSVIGLQSLQIFFFCAVTKWIFAISILQQSSLINALKNNEIKVLHVPAVTDFLFIPGWHPQPIRDEVTQEQHLWRVVPSNHVPKEARHSEGAAVDRVWVRERIGLWWCGQRVVLPLI